MDILPETLRLRCEKGIRQGISGWETSSEVMRLLPKGFLAAYERMCLEALAYGSAKGGGVDGKASARRVTRLSTGQTETRGGAKAGGKKAGADTRSMLLDEMILAKKTMIDRKLRKLGRELDAWLEGRGKDGKKDGRGDGRRGGVRRCSKCKVYSEPEWSFCPNDGARTEEID